MRIRSIGTRLTLWYSCLLTLTCLVLGGTAYGLLSYSIVRDLDAALNGVAEALVQRARQDTTALVPPDVDDLFRRFFGFSPLNRYFKLLDPRGRLDPRRPRTDSLKQRVSPEALRKASRGLPAFETILKGEMEVALHSPRSPEEYQAILRSGLEEIERIIHLVEGLLLLSRADVGVLRLDRQALDLQDLMQEVCAQMGVIAAHRSIELAASPGEPTWISGDRNQLRRVLLNLTDNALKYTPAGGRVRL